MIYKHTNACSVLRCASHTSRNDVKKVTLVSVFTSRTCKYYVKRYLQKKRVTTKRFYGKTTILNLEEKMRSSQAWPFQRFITVSKITENVVHKQIYDYVSKNRFICDFQSGFRRSYSTDTCLLFLTDCIRKELDRGNGPARSTKSFWYGEPFNIIGHRRSYGFFGYS